MRSVKIIAPPRGYAPEDIRVQWVGVTIPLATKEDTADMKLVGFVIKEGGRIESGDASGYLVLRTNAVAALRRAEKNSAADYWDTGHVKFFRFLRFPLEVCEVVE